tara:strand:- start:17168 stop:18076 length:909 start_codon:yes stop_codon:yes gene_type:complete
MPSFTPAPSGNANLPFTVDENGNVIFNDAGANVDFTIESSGNDDTFQVTGSGNGLVNMYQLRVENLISITNGNFDQWSIRPVTTGNREFTIAGSTANRGFNFTANVGGNGAGTSVLYIDGSNGKVGIGETSPTEALDVTGNIIASGNMTCVALTQTSMGSLKKNIATITKTKAKVIPFKEYNFKTGDTTRKRYGVVVEDIENDYPELVYDLGGGVKAVNYIDLLVKRVAEMEKELTELTGAKGDKGDTGAKGDKGDTGDKGSNGKDGNSHLQNVTSIDIDKKTGYLEVRIGKIAQRFAPVDD